MENRTSISLDERQRRRLELRKRGHESFDSVVARLLNETSDEERCRS